MQIDFRQAEPEDFAYCAKLYFARPLKTDEDFTLSEVLARLQIQAIYRESTGNRVWSAPQK